jgi:hypothetical protein
MHGGRCARYALRGSDRCAAHQQVDERWLKVRIVECSAVIGGVSEVGGVDWSNRSSDDPFGQPIS